MRQILVPCVVTAAIAAASPAAANQMPNPPTACDPD